MWCGSFECLTLCEMVVKDYLRGPCSFYKNFIFHTPLDQVGTSSGCFNVVSDGILVDAMVYCNFV